MSQSTRGASPRGVKQPTRTRYQLLFLWRCRQPKYVATRRRRSSTNNVRGMRAIPMRAASSRIASSQRPGASNRQQWIQPRPISGGGRGSGLLVRYTTILLFYASEKRKRDAITYLRWEFRHVQIRPYIFDREDYRNFASRENAQTEASTKFYTTVR